MRAEKQYLISEVDTYLKKSDYVILANFSKVTVAVSVAAGIAFSSSRPMVNGRSTSPVTDRSHSPGAYVGTSPTCSTGKRSVRY